MLRPWTLWTYRKTYIIFFLFIFSDENAKRNASVMVIWVASRIQVHLDTWTCFHRPRKRLTQSSTSIRPKTGSVFFSLIFYKFYCICINFYKRNNGDKGEKTAANLLQFNTTLFPLPDAFCYLIPYMYALSLCGFPRSFNEILLCNWGRECVKSEKMLTIKVKLVLISTVSSNNDKIFIYKYFFLRFGAIQYDTYTFFYCYSIVFQMQLCLKTALFSHTLFHFKRRK